MSSNTTIQFSPREMEVLALAWQCMEAQPKVRLLALTWLRPCLDAHEHPHSISHKPLYSHANL